MSLHNPTARDRIALYTAQLLTFPLGGSKPRIGHPLGPTFGKEGQATVEIPLAGHDEVILVTISAAEDGSLGYHLVRKALKGSDQIVGPEIDINDGLSGVGRLQGDSSLPGPWRFYSNAHDGGWLLSPNADPYVPAHRQMAVHWMQQDLKIEVEWLQRRVGLDRLALQATNFLMLAVGAQGGDAVSLTSMSPVVARDVGKAIDRTDRGCAKFGILVEETLLWVGVIHHLDGSIGIDFYMDEGLKRDIGVNLPEGEDIGFELYGYDRDRVAALMPEFIAKARRARDLVLARLTIDEADGDEGPSP